MWHSMWGWDDPAGVGWMLFSAMHVFWWVVMIAVAVVIFRTITGRSRGPWRRDSAMDILRQRYARGEIDAAEYEERRKQLAA